MAGAPRPSTPGATTGCWPTDRTGGRRDPVVSFASNDYLGLATHPAVVAAAHEALDRWGAGSGASRLVTGSRPVHHELEAALAEWKGTRGGRRVPHRVRRQPVGAVGVRRRRRRRATPTSSTMPRSSTGAGWPGPTSRIVSPRRPRPPSTPRLAGTAGRSIIVSDTVFSMDGDAADLDGLVEVARRHGALLVLDEAHAVLGPGPATPTDGADVLRVGTLSKTLGSLGGFVAGPRRFVELLVNRARPYIFTTAPTPADAAAALAAVGVVRSDEGDALRARLTGHVARCRRPIGIAGHHASPIVPVVIGDEAEAVAASAALLARGCGCRPSARRRCPGHVAAAGHPVGHPHRRAGRPLVGGLAGARARAPPAAHGSGPGRVGQCGLTGWCWCAAPGPRWARPGSAAGSWSSCAPAGARCRPASRPSPSTSTPRAHVWGAPPTPRRLGAASGEHPGDGVPLVPLLPPGHGPPIAAEALGLPSFTVADLVGELDWPPDGSTSAWWRRPEGCGPPRPTTATPATWWPPWPPTWWCWWPTPGSGPSTASACRWTPCRTAPAPMDGRPHRGGAQPVRRPPRDPPAQPGRGWRAGDGYRVVAPARRGDGAGRLCGAARAVSAGSDSPRPALPPPPDERSGQGAELVAPLLAERLVGDQRPAGRWPLRSPGAGRPPCR